jgi:hypothetical protein
VTANRQQYFVEVGSGSVWDDEPPRHEDTKKRRGDRKTAMPRTPLPVFLGVFVSWWFNQTEPLPESSGTENLDGAAFSREKKCSS